MSDDLFDGRPNGYVFTKAVGEHIVRDYFNQDQRKPAVGIIRPGIVGPSLYEPTEGWVDSVQGVAGLSILAGLGIVQTIDWEYNNHSDGIPVDYLVNGIISAAWYIFHQRSHQLTIFNLTSSNIRPISNGQFMSIGREESVRQPSMYFVRPQMQVPKSRPHPLIHRIQRFVYHTLFAYFIDMLLVLFGYKRM